MITRTEADKLRAMRAAEPAVISVYLPIPLDLGEHRGLPTRARELVKASAGRALKGRGAAVAESDVDAVANTVADHSSDWLGHTAAIFASGKIGLLEAIPLPGFLTERAVIANKPYIRPLLAAMQRNPAYRTALIDTRHAWVFNISDDQIEAVAERTGTGVPSSAFAGWDGLDAHRVQQRIMTLSRQHYRDTIEILERTSNGKHLPLVLGGHENEISQFLGSLPRQVKRNVAGSFHVDLQTMTPGRVRELSAPVIARFEQDSEAKVIHDVLNEPPDTVVTTSLARCLSAAKSRAVSELILADDQMVSGYACDECGSLSVVAGGCDCPSPYRSSRAIPDVLDELANQTLDAGGEVTSVRNPPFTAAARLRFPVPARSPGPRRLP